MNGRSRRAARVPVVLPWRTALAAAVLGGAVLATAPTPSDRDVVGQGPGLGDLRVLLSGATSVEPAPVAASGPEVFVLDLPDAAPVRDLPAAGSGMAPAVHEVTPVGFTGAPGR